MPTTPPGNGRACSGVATATSDDSGEYLVLDRWASRGAYEAFRARWSSEYRRLDRRLGEITEEEALIGAFEVIP